MDDNDTCVCCGQYAGEGRQVCVGCERAAGSTMITASGTMSYPEFALAKRCMEMEAEIRRLREALEKVSALGYNKDCLFCGFKDRAVKQALEGGGGCDYR